MVDGGPKTVELAVDLHEHLIQVPAPRRIAAHVRDASLTNLDSEHWVKPVRSEPDGLVADVRARAANPRRCGTTVGIARTSSRPDEILLVSY
jgi:hypothetical protein